MRSPLKVYRYCLELWLNVLFGRADHTEYVSKTRKEER